MQPYGRTVLGQAVLGLHLAVRPTAAFGARPVFITSPCLQLQAPLRRLYSSQLPPKDSGIPSSSPEEPKTEASSTFEANTSTKETNPTPKPNIHNANPKASAAESILSYAQRFNLPSSLESRRSELEKKFTLLMDHFQTRALNATQTLNEVTGYSSIEAIKHENTLLESSLADAHARVRTARHTYKSSNSKRAATQREVTTLLARKESWSPSDLERFTELYRTDHVLEGEVVGAQEQLTEAEAEEQSLSQRLNAGILKRYHEEQIWSDRIRRASTWGTWGLMGMNFLLFVVLQVVAEPWKRKRLARAVVEEEKAVLEEVRNELGAVKMALQERERERQVADVSSDQAPIALAPVILEAVVEEAAKAEVTPESSESWKEFLSNPERWRDPERWRRAADVERWRRVAEDLCSERRLDLRMKDASILALQGAVAGAVLAGSFMWCVVRR